MMCQEMESIIKDWRFTFPLEPQFYANPWCIRRHSYYYHLLHYYYNPSLLLISNTVISLIKTPSCLFGSTILTASTVSEYIQYKHIAKSPLSSLISCFYLLTMKPRPVENCSDGCPSGSFFHLHTGPVGSARETPRFLVASPTKAPPPDLHCSIQLDREF